MLRWLRGDSRTSAGGSALGGALADAFDPGAARARQELEREHERVEEAPTPGDRLLHDGVLVVRRAPAPSEDPAPAASPADAVPRF